MPDGIANNGKPWTEKDRRKAAAMWRAGKSCEAIATALNRGKKGIEHLAVMNRDLFPERRARRSDYGNGVGNTAEIKLCIPEPIHAKLKAIAAERNVSMNQVVREAVRAFTNQGAPT